LEGPTLLAAGPLPLPLPALSAKTNKNHSFFEEGKLEPKKKISRKREPTNNSTCICWQVQTRNQTQAILVEECILAMPPMRSTYSK
jgi:hypothetical protein